MSGEPLVPAGSVADKFATGVWLDVGVHATERSSEGREAPVGRKEAFFQALRSRRRVSACSPQSDTSPPVPRLNACLSDSSGSSRTHRFADRDNDSSLRVSTCSLSSSSAEIGPESRMTSLP